MKTGIRNYKTMSIALLVALSLSTFTMANDENKNKGVPPIEFKYVGKIEGQPVFQLNLNNSEGEDFVISFRDNLGNVLYSNNVKSNFSQNFMINSEEVGDDILTVEVRSKKTRKTEVYTIKRNQTIVDETVVAKIN